MRFAHLTVQHAFERMRLRGLTGARDEFHFAAIVQNLRRWRCVYSARQQVESARRLRKWRVVVCELADRIRDRALLTSRALSVSPATPRRRQTSKGHCSLACHRSGPAAEALRRARLG
ncbi:MULTISPECIES: hypothetical protein [Bradyrhizobium]|uniref:hypothetical protein n=1 Tax=Bradyrhizobium elkanii TaxID=29448 RepID=UPI0009B79451